MTSRFEVRLTRGAERDLADLYEYLAANAGVAVAESLLDDVMTQIAALEFYPERGAIPKELQALGMADFRQTLCGPYRLIYRVIAAVVFIVLIADGRRDMGALLHRRLLAR
jgi:toxin ParE1/3/4